MFYFFGRLEWLVAQHVSVLCFVSYQNRSQSCIEGINKRASFEGGWCIEDHLGERYRVICGLIFLPVTRVFFLNRLSGFPSCLHVLTSFLLNTQPGSLKDTTIFLLSPKKNLYRYSRRELHHLICD